MLFILLWHLASRCWAEVGHQVVHCDTAQLSADGWWRDGPVTAVSILTRNYDDKLSTFYRESFFRPLYLDCLLVVRGYNVIMYSVTLALIVALRASNVATLSLHISINPADSTHHQSSGLRILSKWYLRDTESTARLQANATNCEDMKPLSASSSYYSTSM